MTGKPDTLYFRTRDNGASVFRVDVENRQRRIDMRQIAVVNLNNGQIREVGNEPATAEEMARIENWKAERGKIMSRRTIDDIFRAIDHLNLTAQWAQSKASDQELEQFTDDLLMAMHDLRSVLVRKKSERLQRGDG